MRGDELAKMNREKSYLLSQQNKINQTREEIEWLEEMRRISHSGEEKRELKKRIASKRKKIAKIHNYISLLEAEFDEHWILVK